MFVILLYISVLLSINKPWLFCSHATSHKADWIFTTTRRPFYLALYELVNCKQSKNNCVFSFSLLSELSYLLCQCFQLIQNNHFFVILLYTSVLLSINNCSVDLYSGDLQTMTVLFIRKIHTRLTEFLLLLVVCFVLSYMSWLIANKIKF